LLKEGPLTIKELQEKTTALKARFTFAGEDRKYRRAKRIREKRRGAYVSIEEACNSLVSQQFLCINSDARYALTDLGKAKAEHTVKTMEKGAEILEKQLLSPAATARNTLVSYACMAALKLAGGLFGGSVGLMADGADTSVDTASAGVVWLGIKFKRELLGTVAILALMFATAVTLFYQSANSIIENVQGTFVPMSMPLVVIAVEGIALLLMFTFSMYQRFVGRRSKSLALISQSIDSKNSVYSAAAVIIGALFSIFGIYWVDAVVGGFIAVRITWNSIDLTRQAINSLKGKEPDFTKFKLPFEEQIATRRMKAFSNWVLYAIHEEKIGTKEEIICSLERAFRPKYMPTLFSEFTAGKGLDFNANFDQLVQPWLDKAYLTHENGAYTLTDAGKSYTKHLLSTLRYRETEL
jgi:cation diffusion facilitator family transporter